jgi:hypothetical protein
MPPTSLEARRQVESVGICKPNSVRHCAVAIIRLGDALPRHSSDLPGRLANRAGSLDRDACAPQFIRPYLVLLRVGFAMQRSLLNARCALTAPFHPYLLRGGIFSVALSVGQP